MGISAFTAISLTCLSHTGAHGGSGVTLRRLRDRRPALVRQDQPGV